MPPPDALLGQEINGKYRVIDVLATGGMGRVYRAEQIPLGRMVALKVLLPALTGDGSPSDATRNFRQRFVREASVLAKLQNPYTVTLFDYGRIDSPRDTRERFFMAMELLEGETLQHRLETAGRLPVDKARSFLQQLALGLRAAHALGVVHRDIKPPNVMIVAGEEGGERVKLLDFGVTKVMSEATEATEEGILIGSPRFMAPEQVVGEPVDARTDIYALGVVAFAMLSGAPPFKAETAVATMMAHLNNPFPGDKLPADVPLPLRKLVERCMQKARADRFQTADELLAALRDTGVDGADGSSPGVGVHPNTSLVRRSSASFAARSRRRRWGAALGSAVISAACVTAMLLARAGRRGATGEATASATAPAPGPTTASSAAVAPPPPSPSAAATNPAGSPDRPGDAPAPPAASATAAAAARASASSPARARPGDKRATSPERPAASAAPPVPSTAPPAAPAPARSVDPFGERL